MLNNPIMLGLTDVFGNASIESFLKRQGIDVSIVSEKINVIISKKDEEENYKPAVTLSFPNDIFGRNYRELMGILVEKAKASGRWNKIADKFIVTGFNKWYERMEKFVFTEELWKTQIREFIPEDEEPDLYVAYHLATEKARRVETEPSESSNIKEYTLAEWMKDGKPDGNVIRDEVVFMMADTLRKADPDRDYVITDQYLSVSSKDREDTFVSLRTMDFSKVEFGNVILASGVEARRFEKNWFNPNKDKIGKIPLTIGMKTKISLHNFKCLSHGKVATADELVQECADVLGQHGVTGRPSDYLLSRRGVLVARDQGYALRPEQSPPKSTESMQ